MIAPLLMLIPGVPIVNTVMDLVRGHADISMARLHFVGLLIGMITMGVLFVTVGCGLLQGDTPWKLEEAASRSIHAWPLWQHVVADCVLASVASLGFATLFKVPRSLHLWVCSVAWVGHGFKTLLMGSVNHGNHTALCTFLGTSTMLLAAEAMGRWRGIPEVVLYVPGLVMLMPGVFFIDSILCWFWLLQYYHHPKDFHHMQEFQTAFVDGWTLMMRAMLIVGGIGFGVSIPNMLLHSDGMSLVSPSRNMAEEDDEESSSPEAE